MELFAFLHKFTGNLNTPPKTEPPFLIDSSAQSSPFSHSDFLSVVPYWKLPFHHLWAPTTPRSCAHLDHLTFPPLEQSYPVHQPAHHSVYNTQALFSTQHQFGSKLDPKSGLPPLELTCPDRELIPFEPIDVPTSQPFQSCRWKSSRD